MFFIYHHKKVKYVHKVWLIMKSLCICKAILIEDRKNKFILLQ